MEESNVVNSIATHTKRHVERVMDNWRTRTNWANIFTKLSYRVKDVAKASRKDHAGAMRRSEQATQAPNHTLTT